MSSSLDFAVTIMMAFVPIVGILGGAYIVINTIFTQPMNAGIGLAITLTGLPVYYVRKIKFKN